MPWSCAWASCSPYGGLLIGLGKLTRSTPIVPLIGGERTRLQPVHVNDVAEAVVVVKMCRHDRNVGVIGLNNACAILLDRQAPQVRI
jgi:hypothetical protein